MERAGIRRGDRHFGQHTHNHHHQQPGKQIGQQHRRACPRQWRRWIRQINSRRSPPAIDNIVTWRDFSPALNPVIATVAPSFTLSKVSPRAPRRSRAGARVLLLFCRSRLHSPYERTSLPACVLFYACFSMPCFASLKAVGDDLESLL